MPVEIEGEIGVGFQFLQHIRINGTLVGGLIGLLLFALSHAAARAAFGG